MPVKGDVEQYKRTVLEAVAANRPAVMRTYLGESGLNVDVVYNSNYQNLLHVAAFHGAEDTVDVMLKYERVLKVLDNRDGANRTALHLAAATGYGGVVKSLAAARARLDVQDDEGHTPLHLAVKFEWPEAVRVLLDAGADPLIEDVHGQNSLDIANAKADKEIICLMAAFAGRRQPSSGLLGLTRCLAPQWGPKASGEEDPWFHLSVADWLANGSLRDPDGKPIARAPPPSALLRGEEGSPAAAASPDSSGLRVAGRAAPAAAPMKFEFGKEVQRLEFEVEWAGKEPMVGNVKPGGEADKRGMVKGDRLVEIAGKKTHGKAREELLPLLKQRPLIIKVERDAKAQN